MDETVPAFEIRFHDHPDVPVLIYADGRVSGVSTPGIVINRIPRLIAEAREDLARWRRRAFWGLVAIFVLEAYLFALIYMRYTACTGV